MVGVSSRIFCRERREPEASLSYNRALPVYSGGFDPYLYCQRHDNGEEGFQASSDFCKQQSLYFYLCESSPMISFSRAGVGPGGSQRPMVPLGGPLCPSSDRGDCRRLRCVTSSLTSAATASVWLPPSPTPPPGRSPTVSAVSFASSRTFAGKPERHLFIRSDWVSLEPQPSA